MRTKFLWLIAFFAGLGNVSFAGSVRLYNDSPFPLVAVVLAADGSVLGKTDVKPRSTIIWEGGWSGGPISQTPYTVRWLCSNGGKEYSTCTFVGQGAMAVAGECEGERICPQKREQDDTNPVNSG